MRQAHIWDIRDRMLPLLNACLGQGPEGTEAARYCKAEDEAMRKSVKKWVVSGRTTQSFQALMVIWWSFRRYS